ncbi:MAG: sugar phosphate isomerase/epimerase [Tannerellaceae bacterium]|jgi:hexulose-6-phosphate isomerase|nr:sugar phosphate isomerase/epimerase [Tannerellaceae bacterium]
MERRNFIRKALLGTGALSVASTGNLVSAVNNTGVYSSTGKNALPGTQMISENNTPLLKSIMWETAGSQGSVLDRCKAIKAAGFDGIEPSSHMDRNEVSDAMKVTGLKASSVCNSKHWDLLMSHPDVEVRRKGVEAMIVAMEDAKAYGTDAVLLVPGIVDENTSYEDCWKRSIECIRELLPVAEEMRMKICIENVWNNFLLSPVEMKMYLQQFDSAFVRAYFDCGNILIYGWPEHWISSLGNLIGRIHIKEFSKQKADQEGRWAGSDVDLTEGDIRWKEVMVEIKRHYSGGWLTTEQGNSETAQELSDLSGRLDKILALY